MARGEEEYQGCVNNGHEQPVPAAKTPVFHPEGGHVRAESEEPYAPMDAAAGDQLGQEENGGKDQPDCGHAGDGLLQDLLLIDALTPELRPAFLQNLFPVPRTPPS